MIAAENAEKGKENGGDGGDESVNASRWASTSHRLRDVGFGVCDVNGHGLAGADWPSTAAHRAA